MSRAEYYLRGDGDIYLAAFYSRMGDRSHRVLRFTYEMRKTLTIFRLFFLLSSFCGCVLMSYVVSDWGLFLTLSVGMSIAALVILTDILLEGFSLRGLSAVTFGLAMGALIALLISNSPLFEPLEESPELAEMLFLVRLTLYIVTMYLATVIALRGKDEFNLVIPYVSFSAQNVESRLAVVDTSALIDGRIVEICESGWFVYHMIVPHFVLDELQSIADSPDSSRKEKGRKGLDVLNRLRKIESIELRIHDSEVPDREAVDSKLIYLCESMNAKLLTTDFNLAKLAEFHGIGWLNLTNLLKALNQEISVGAKVTAQLVRAGKDAGQAIGYLPDGSMLVVNQGKEYIGTEVCVEVDSVVPSAGGKMVFATYTSAE